MQRVATPWCRPANALGVAVFALTLSGCATMRRFAPDPVLRPCGDGYTTTADGWRLGIRRFPAAYHDPNKLPVVLCHGLGLNATFWTITNDDLPRQLAARGYDVYVPDMRGSGSSHREGAVGMVNQYFLRQMPTLEIGDGDWSVDDEIQYDVPAILDYVERETGHKRVNWVGHSLGGMLMFAYLETSPDSWRIANFVGMGSTVVQAKFPQIQMLRANRGIRNIMRVISTGRIARPMMLARPRGLEKVDRFYYTAANVDKSTVDRFYGFTLENPGRGALQQLDSYLEFGQFESADRSVDYFDELGRVTAPTLMIAGDGDVMSDIPSTMLTYNKISSQDKTLMRFGKAEGHIDDYGHCDLVWSRHAPREIFPALIDWLDSRQPVASPQHPTPQHASPQVPTPQAAPPR